MMKRTFIPAGYTYPGQFIDHDISHPASSLQRQEPSRSIGRLSHAEAGSDNIIDVAPQTSHICSKMTASIFVWATHSRATENNQK